MWTKERRVVTAGRQQQGYPMTMLLHLGLLEASGLPKCESGKGIDANELTPMQNMNKNITPRVAQAKLMAPVQLPSLKTHLPRMVCACDPWKLCACTD